jgi:Chemoreceptor zinc-binding domain
MIDDTCKGEQMTSEVFDINEARLAHLRWEIALNGLIKGAIRPLEGHENCPLGMWIDGEGGRRYADNKTFGVLKVAHKQFHRLATGLINSVAAGDMSHTSEYLDKVRLVSQQVLFLLTSIELNSFKEEKNGLIKRIRCLVQNRPECDVKPAECSTLSVNEARLRHLHWVGELEEFLRGGQQLNKIQSAEDCALGIWLHLNINVEMGNPLYLATLDKAHREFHQLVKDTISALQCGNYPLADNYYSKAYDCSAKVIMLLTKLELELGQYITENGSGLHLMGTYSNDAL